METVCVLDPQQTSNLPSAAPSGLSGMSHRKNKLPRWRGFNLLGRFLPPGDDRFQDMRPGEPSAFVERDFEMMAEMGFDFVRVPLCYWWWSSPENPLTIEDSALDTLDMVLSHARASDLHVSLNFHHAPGYCVNDPIRPEPFDLWRDEAALEAFAFHWSAFAQRFRGVSSRHLSFDLLNEPPAIDLRMTQERHEQVIRTAVKAIRDFDNDRLIFANGTSWGTVPSPEFGDLNIAQSCRGYFPAGVSHYLADWGGVDIQETPKWPGANHAKEQNVDLARLESFYEPWRDLMATGVGVHCGEMGCWNKTPHGVTMAWLRDLLGILKSAKIGWAMWNFRGSFGVLDSNRADVRYEKYRGHLLDRQMLELLQAS